jgi:hypothetical protein
MRGVICLRILIKYLIGPRITSLEVLYVRGMGSVRHAAEPFVAQPSASGVEAATGKLKFTSLQLPVRFQLK